MFAEPRGGDSFAHCRISLPIPASNEGASGSRSACGVCFLEGRR
jgi:hypothetical protein